MRRLTAVVLMMACPVSAQTVRELGVLPGGDATYPTAVSDDGSVVAGYGDVAGGNLHAFRWTSAGGMQDLGTLAGGSTDQAYGLSLDGAVVAGLGDSSSGYRAFRWTSAGGMVNLGVLPGGLMSAVYYDGVNADGSVIVGQVTLPGSIVHAFRWTSASGMTDLGTLPGGTHSFARAVTPDGELVVGFGYGSGVPHAFRWTAAGGMLDLDIPPAAASSDAVAVSADGSVIVGGTSECRAFRWTASGVLKLGTLAGDIDSQAFAVSGDGSVILGWSGDFTNPMPQHQYRRSFVWTAQTGMLGIEQYLSAHGISWSGGTGATAISADGSTIVGGGGQGWAATLRSCYANCDHSTTPPILNVGDFVCFQQRFAAGDPAANCDGSTTPPTLNVADFVCFQQAFAAGCP
jgi:probable HAF family extracellular repeat protein